MMQKNNQTEYPIPEDLLYLWDEVASARYCRESTIRLPSLLFRKENTIMSRAIWYGKRANALEREFFTKAVELHPELTGVNNYTLDRSKRVIRVPADDDSK